MMFDSMAPLVWVHFLTAMVALPLGAAQLLRPHGTAAHRLRGRIYVPVMLASLITALATFRVGTPFLFFHVLALVGLGSLLSGMWNLRRWLREGNPAHLRSHKVDMAFSWLGLFMAGMSQLLVNPRFGIASVSSGWSFWAMFAALNLLLWGAGSWWIFRRLVPASETTVRQDGR